MDFTIWLGPLPVHWIAQIELVSPGGFSDRQVQRPFHAWLHRHTFIPIDDHTCDVQDEITFHLQLHILWSVVGLAMALGLPFLFAYRAFQTQRLLR